MLKKKEQTFNEEIEKTLNFDKTNLYINKLIFILNDILIFYKFL